MPNDSYRFRASLPPLAGVFSYENTVGAHGSNTFEYWTHFSRIIDSINPVKFGTDGKRPPGYCKHDTCTVTYLAPSVNFAENPAQYPGVVTTMHNYSANRMGQLQPDLSAKNDPAFNGWLNLLSPFESSSTFANLCVSAFNKQITQVPAKTSAVNFIFELLELKPIFRKLASIPNHVREGTLARAVSGKRLSRRSPLNAARSGAKGFLAAEFQWLPFVSDIQAFTSSVDRVTKRLDYLRKTKGKETTVRFVKEDCNVVSLQEVKLLNDSYYDREAISLEQYQCDFISTWKLYQNLDGLDDAWAGLRGVIADLGVNNPLKIVWNAIPFSFLVDWVAPFSSWLERLAVQPFYGTWDVYDVTCSLHEKSRYNLNFVAKYGGTSGMIARVEVERYLRLPYLPLTLGAIDFSQLTDTQQKLAASLLVVQGRR